jgi:TolB-like protein
MLGARAFDVLVALIERRDRLVPPKEIFEAVWPGLIVEESNLRQQIAALRRLLGPDAIATVAGKGYRFTLTLDVTTSADSSPVPTATTRPIIAVLPFTNLSGYEAQQYFSDAVSQDIISALAKHRWLNVLARNTTFGYRGEALDMGLLRSELGADYVVQGGVRRSGSRVRVTVELIETAAAGTCWSERYDREVKEIFALQDEIVESIVGQLEPEIGHAERLRVGRSHLTNLHAWDSFHLGVAHFFRFTAQDNAEALRLLQRSRDLDPLFGEPHAWWAYAVVLSMVYWDAEPDPALLDQALAATQQALAIDGRNALFYALKARVQLARQDYGSARRENEMAIELTPTLAAAHCGLGDTLAYEGRFDEAIECFNKALSLSPRDPQRWAFLTYAALAMIFKGDFERALELTNLAVEIPNCQYWTVAHRAVALTRLGRSEEAREGVGVLLSSEPRFSVEFARRKLFYVKDQRQVTLYLQALSQAGVPEKVTLEHGRITF